MSSAPGPGGQDPLPASTPQLVASDEASAAPLPAKGSRLRAWFRRSERAPRPTQEKPAALALVYRQRALSAQALAERAREPSSAFVHGAPDALLCDLYRQSAYWALLALTTPPLAPATTLDAEGAGLVPDPATLFSSSDAALLLRAAGGREALLTIERIFMSGTFDQIAEWDREQQAASLWDLRRFARALLLEASADSEARRRSRVVRWLRVGVVVGLLVLCAGGVFLWMAAREQRLDLARGRVWRTSSVGAQGCRPPLQECDEAHGFFFHTEDEKAPWIEIDLGKPTSFSSVRVVNRLDCCQARATPLVVEVSDNQATWRELAGQASTFKSWKATFPAARGRYVRVRAVKKTILHLAQVRVLP
ncbi:MAG TPA: discoidin domain-containing protein [Polyangiaceae bacterium]|nr:discoidin domain-containing protein [Polyangiaceae bacterium]